MTRIVVDPITRIEGVTWTLLSPGSSDSISVTVIAVDASRNTVASVPVTVSVDANAVVTASTGSTGTDGKLTATVIQGTDRTNRTVTVSATSGSITRTTAFTVTGAQLAATLSKPVVNAGESQTITFRLTDVNGGILVRGVGMNAEQITGVPRQQDLPGRKVRRCRKPSRWPRRGHASPAIDPSSPA